ncbi:hypothetical protein AB0G15_18350 [Streptosporangium sp. NPDC023825]|uniref:hypothetical protein n=1 Tax=Streptosporangium sp. NPDC023825 TaxID=3154909 RepID=UPI00341B145B
MILELHELVLSDHLGPHDTGRLHSMPGKADLSYGRPRTGRPAFALATGRAVPYQRRRQDGNGLVSERPAKVGAMSGSATASRLRAIFSSDPA